MRSDITTGIDRQRGPDPHRLKLGAVGKLRNGWRHHEAGRCAGCRGRPAVQSSKRLTLEGTSAHHLLLASSSSETACAFHVGEGRDCGQVQQTGSGKKRERLQCGRCVLEARLQGLRPPAKEGLRLGARELQPMAKLGEDRSNAGHAPRHQPRRIKPSPGT